MRRRFALVAGAVLAALLWRQLFELWAHRLGYQLFKLADRMLGNAGPGAVLATDCLFALVAAAVFATLFLRLVRSGAYAAEAIAVPAFLAGLFASGWLLDGDAMFFVRLPALWLFVMIFAIIVGYAEKFRRRRAATAPAA